MPHWCLDFLTYLPTEIALYILLQLALPDLISTSLVSLQWRSLSMDNLVWRDLFHRETRWRIREEVEVEYEMEVEEDSTLLSERSKVLITAMANSDTPSTPRKYQSLGAQLSRSGSTSSLRSLTRSGSVNGMNERRPSITSMSSSMSLSLSLSRRSSIGSGTVTPRQPTSPSSSSSSVFLRDLPPASLSGSPSLSRRSSLTSSLSSPSTIIKINSNSPQESSLDWTKLYKDRYALEKRWEEGKPKSDWLTGHTDSVYCLQFDKNKVVSGSVCLFFLCFATWISSGMDKN